VKDCVEIRFLKTRRRSACVWFVDKGKAIKSTIHTSSLLSTISAQVVLEIMGSCVTSKVASKVMTVAWAEVLVADSIDVILVTGVCDVDVASVDEFL
jgi:hypothetical protein